MYKLDRSGIRSLSLVAGCVLASCAAQQAVQSPPEIPRSQQTSCNVVGVEARSTPLQENADSLSLLAVFPLPEADTPPPKESLAFTSQINRSRTDEPENQFQGPAEQLCPPDTNSHAHSKVTPFSPTPVVEQ